MKRLLAIVVAGIYGVPRFGLRECLARGWFMLRGMLSFGDRVDDFTAAQRLALCRKCDLYYEPLETCGSPLDKKLEEVGCWCHMPSKVKTKCNCWMLDKTEGLVSGWAGWPGLDSHPWPTFEAQEKGKGNT